MSVWVVVPMLVWLVGFSCALGVLAERERLTNPGGERGVAWMAALVFSSALWFVFIWLWPSSRPVPPQPTDTRKTPSWQWQGLPGQPFGMPMRTVTTPRDLDQLESLPPGERVFLSDKDVVVVRSQQGAFVGWRGENCACWWNTMGYPVVLCRTHRSDVDPQGEPDESEGEVGR